MMNTLYGLIIFLYLSGPVMAQEAAVHKSPLSYSLREYGLILLIAMVGGFVRWFTAVRKGEANAYSIRVLVGELGTSAFMGILTFWVCEAMDVQSLLTYALAGMAGHAGVAGLMWAERVLKKFFENKYGVPSTDRAPLDDK